MKFLKIVANKFSRFYIFVIRGTPMMVQSLILYNAVFGRLSRVNAQKSKNIFYEARMRAISSRKSCSEHR